MTRLLKTIYNYRVTLLYLPLAVYWISIFVLTTIPSESMPHFALHDKGKHFLAYFILSVLLSLTINFQNRKPELSKKYLSTTFLITILYSTLDEIHQVFIPGRSAELLDWLANLAGILLALQLIKAIIRRYFIKP